MATVGEYHPERGPNGNPYLEALVSDSWWDNSSAITYYASDDDADGRDWSAEALAALDKAFDLWATVADLTFQKVGAAADANLVEIVDTASGSLGWHDLPDISGPTFASEGHYNIGGLGWDAAGLQLGGYGFITLIHELGHGLGLEHPHDFGEFPGVTADTGDFGDNDLNQGIFTTMSYNDGWASVQDPFGNGLVNYGYQATPGAFDIAAVQYMYGANTNFASGNNIYDLPETNQPGTFWSTIWDTGGVDTLRYAGNDDAILNLTAATIDNSPTGGDVPSFASGIFGGFTIANGVVIENAEGGSGNDGITGNAAANLLSGNGGDDTIAGGAGADFLRGGTGADLLQGGGGKDTVGFNGSIATTVDLRVTGIGQNTGHGDDTLVGIENASTDGGDDRLFGNDLGNALAGNKGADKIQGFGGDDTLNGGDEADILVGGGGADRLNGGSGADRLSSGGGSDRLTGKDGGDTLKGGAGNDNLNGGAGNDKAFGGTGKDTLNGGGGRDQLQGDAGNDRIIGGSGTDTALYSGKIGRYDVIKAGSKIKIIDTTGKLGTDIVSGVEKLKFGGTVYKIKQALKLAAPAPAADDKAEGSNDPSEASYSGRLDAVFLGFETLTTEADDLLA